MKDGFEIKTDLYTREEAASFRGIQPCSLLGTGLIAMDVRIFTGMKIGDEVVKLPPPFFAYEFTDETRSVKSTTEDMYWSRNLGLLFGKYGMAVGHVDWDAWCGHAKTEIVTKPRTIDVLTVAPMHRQE